MPEGVELLISKELLQPLVVNKTITAAIAKPKGRYAFDKSGLGEFTKLLSELPLVVSQVNVKGKFMYWELSKDNEIKFYMFSTFGMSGQWSQQEGKHPCFEFTFSDGSSIFFNDPRHFGTIKFTSNKQDLIDKLAELGWDPFTPFENKKSFIFKALKNSKKSICEDLMNQKIFAGVGNYIKSECLYLSKMSPWKSSSALSETEVLTLCSNIIAVMQDSYNHQGATISTYKDAYGAEGKYSSKFKVYSQKVDPNGYKVIKEQTSDGRTTHWCPEVQKF